MMWRACWRRAKRETVEPSIRDTKKLLLEALDTAKKARLGRDPLVAEVHLQLGIVYFQSAQRDAEAAKREFIAALTIDRSVRLSKAYATDDMEAVFADALAELPPEESKPDTTCEGIMGMKHSQVGEATAGEAIVVTASVARTGCGQREIAPLRQRQRTTKSSR